MRLIYDDDLKRLVDEEWFDCKEKSSFFDEIDRTPTVDLVKHGEWETKFTPTECNPFGDYPILIMRCSVCKTKITLWTHEDENIKEKWRYCPNCGARMSDECAD